MATDLRAWGGIPGHFTSCGGARRQISRHLRAAPGLHSCVAGRKRNCTGQNVSLGKGDLSSPPQLVACPQRLCGGSQAPDRPFERRWQGRREHGLARFASRLCQPELSGTRGPVCAAQAAAAADGGWHWAACGTRPPAQPSCPAGEESSGLAVLLEAHMAFGNLFGLGIFLTNYSLTIKKQTLKSSRVGRRIHSPDKQLEKHAFN